MGYKAQVYILLTGGLFPMGTLAKKARMNLAGRVMMGAKKLSALMPPITCDVSCQSADAH
jgi:hypothetical protein